MAIKTEKEFSCTCIQERGPLDTDSYMIFDILNSRFITHMYVLWWSNIVTMDSLRRVRGGLSEQRYAVILVFRCT